MGLTNTTTNLSYARNELIKVGASFIFDKVGDMIYYMLTNNDVTTARTEPLTIGADGDGDDLKAWGDTSSSYMLWDADTDSLKILQTAKTTASNGVYSDLVCSGAWTSGNMTALRGRATISGANNFVSATGVWAGLIMTTSTGSGSGLTCAINAEVESNNSQRPNSILYLQSLPGSSADFSDMPYMVFSETRGGAEGTGSRILFEVGHNAAGTIPTIGSGELFNTNTLRIAVNETTGNRTAFYIPLSTVEATFTYDGAVALTGTLTTGVNQTGVDVKFFGDTSGVYMEWDADDDRLEIVNGFVTIGSFGTGIPINDTIKYALEVHTEPGSALTATGLAAGIRSRLEISAAQTNQVTFCAVDARLRVKAAMADGVHSGLQASIESDAVAYTGTSTTQRNAGTFTIELADGATISSGWLCGVAIDSATHSNVDVSSCTYAALRVNMGSSKEAWTYGAYITGCVNGIYISTEDATASGKNGVYVANTFTYATAGVHKGIQSDITYTPSTSGYGTSIGVAGKVILNGNFTGGAGYMWGVQGQMHFNDGCTINNEGSVWSAGRFVLTEDSGAGGWTHTDGHLCAVLIDSLLQSSVTLSTGQKSLLRIGNWGQNSLFCTFDSIFHVYGRHTNHLFYFFDCDAADSFITAETSNPTGDWTHKIKVYLNNGSLTRYIMLCSDPS